MYTEEIESTHEIEPDRDDENENDKYQGFLYSNNEAVGMELSRLLQKKAFLRPERSRRLRLTSELRGFSYRFSKSSFD